MVWPWFSLLLLLAESVYVQEGLDGSNLQTSWDGCCSFIDMLPWAYGRSLYFSEKGWYALPMRDGVTCCTLCAGASIIFGSISSYKTRYQGTSRGMNTACAMRV